MSEPQTLAQLTLSRSATYRITICGCLDRNWFDQQERMHVCPVVLDHQLDVTVLTATFRDQADLLGTLNQLYNLGFPILAIECLALPPE